MPVYQITKKSKRVAKPKQPYKYMTPPQDIEKPIGVVQGRKPGSKLEWWVALALWRMKVDFTYQYSIYGGTTVRGGYVIDFLVHNSPFPLPLLVQGDYWHRDEKRTTDAFMLDQIKKHFKGQCQEPHELWENELTSSEVTYNKVKEVVL